MNPGLSRTNAPPTALRTIGSLHGRLSLGKVLADTCCPRRREASSALLNRIRVFGSIKIWKIVIIIFKRYPHKNHKSINLNPNTPKISVLPIFEKEFVC